MKDIFTSFAVVVLSLFCITAAVWPSGSKADVVDMYTDVRWEALEGTLVSQVFNQTMVGDVQIDSKWRMATYATFEFREQNLTAVSLWGYWLPSSPGAVTGLAFAGWAFVFTTFVGMVDILVRLLLMLVRPAAIPEKGLA